ncbi:MAG: transposase [Phycisphaerales bacterium]|nr:transposase [Phycisphaerales bacterium]MCB9856269.1 transposase [Phycisphaerales bacterium]MCB9863292.1 transposase [Phycisphaerales bacterium]
MSDYIRFRDPGGAYFFTLITNDRAPIFRSPHARRLLRESFIAVQARFHFDVWAIALLPEHLHCIWILPRGDSDYAKRWSMIKRTFSKTWLSHDGVCPPVSASRRRHRELGVWQRRFWEHRIRNDAEQYAYRDYIHLNPVKHGYVQHPQEWKWSSVHRHLELG